MNNTASLESETSCGGGLTPPPRNDESPEEEEEEEEEAEELQGQTVVAHSGLTIDCASAAFGARSPTDPETEDEFGYTSLKVSAFL